MITTTGFEMGSYEKQKAVYLIQGGGATFSAKLAKNETTHVIFQTSGKFFFLFFF